MDTEVKKEIKNTEDSTEQDLQVDKTPPSHGGAMPKKTFLLILVLALITVGLLAVSLLPNNANKKASDSETAIVAPDPVQTTLEISSPEVATNSATAYTADVIIDTQEAAQANGVQLELSYDPAVLTNVDIKPGDFFDNPNVLLKKIDKVNGKVSFAIYKPEGTSGAGIAAVLSFTKLGSADTATKIDVLPKTQVSAVGLAQSILKTSTGTEF